MSTAAETINLASLHPDVVRRIIRFDERYAIQFLIKARLISRSWNAIVLDYLSNRRNLPNIEIVEIPGTQTWPDFLGPIVRFIEGFLIYVSIPHIYSIGIGMDRWTEIIQTSERLVEMRNVMHPIPLPCREDKPFYAAILASVGAFWYWCGGLSFMLVGGSVILPISMIIGLCYYKFYKRDTKLTSRFKRIFQRFSQIKCLKLWDLEDHTLNIVERRFRDISIVNLTINFLRFGEPTKSKKKIRRTVGLCRKHCVRHVFLPFREVVDGIYFRKLVIELIHMGVKLDVFDCQISDPQHWLGQNQMWWDELANDLSSLQISMRMVTKEAPNFRTHYVQRGVHAHFQFRKFGDENLLAPLRPIPITRGCWGY